MNLFIILVAGVSISGCVPETSAVSSSEVSVNTFEDCLIDEGDVFPTSPRQCKVNGNTFIEDTRIGKKGDTREIRFLISPNTESCQSVLGTPFNCLLINGRVFSDQIEGYTHKQGRTRIIKVLRTQYCDPSIFNDCPQDAGIYRYRLLEIE